MKSKGHYLDCLELIERNSRHSEYVKNQADELRKLVDDHFELLEKYDELQRELEEENCGQRQSKSVTQ